jgi:signal transduction histidine kinase
VSTAEGLAERIRELERSLDETRTLDARWLELVHGAVHNLRTPLATVTGYLELLVLDPDRLDGREREFVARAAAGARTLGRQLELLDDLARLEAGHCATVREERELGALAELALARLEVDERGRMAWRVRTRGTVGGDPELVTRALGGIVCRALARSPEGDGIELALTAEPGDRLRFATYDRGAPLSDAQVTDLFGAPGPPGGRQRSPRLDLHFAQRVAERHDGSVGAATTADGWTAIWLELPVTAGGAPAA